jgi:hypothetical protein
VPRLMSVSLTEEQVRARAKDVTRRDGWRMLQPGDQLTLCRKVMGRRQGEPLVRIVDVVVIDVRRERLDSITDEDVRREGFPAWSAAEFVGFFCQTHKGVTPRSEVTRIEWRYLDDEATLVADVAAVDKVQQTVDSPVDDRADEGGRRG